MRLPMKPAVVKENVENKSFIYLSNSYSGAGSGNWITSFTEKNGDSYNCTKYQQNYYFTGNLFDNDYLTVDILSYAIVTITAKVPCSFIDKNGVMQQLAIGDSVTGDTSHGWVVFG